MKVSKDLKSFLFRYPYLFVFGFCFILYFNSIFNGYNIDDELVTQNHQLATQGIKAVPEIIASPYFSDEMGHKYEYRPVVLISFAVEYQLLGQNAHVSHFINLLLYGLLCVILLVVLNALLGPEYAFFNILVVLVFAAHPMHTEAVDSIKNRDELLALIFALLATRQAINYYDKSSWLGFIFSLLLLALGMFSKQSIINFSFIIPLALFLFRPVRLAKLIGYTLVITFLMVIPLNINLLYQKAGLILLNVGFFCLLAGHKALFAGVRKFIRFNYILIKDIVFRVKKMTLTVLQFLKSMLRYLKEGMINRGRQVVTYIEHNIVEPQSFLEPPVKLPAWFNLLIALILVAGGGWLAVVFNNKAAIAGGILIALIYLVQTLQARGKVIALYILTLAIALIAWYGQLGALFRPFLLLFYFFLIYVYAWKRSYLLQIYGLIALIGIIMVGVSKGDFMQFLFPMLFLYLMNRTNKTYLRFLLWLFIAGLRLIVREITVVTFIDIGMVTGVFLFFVSGNNHRVSYFFGRVFLLLLPLAVMAVILTDKNLNATGSLVLMQQNLPISPPPINNPLPAAPSNYFHISQVPEPTTKIKNFLTTDISFTPTATRPLTFIEFPLDSATPIDIKLGTSFSTLGHYLQKVILPYPLGFYYGYAMIKPESLYNFKPIVVLVFYAFILFSALYLIRRNRIVSFACFTYLAGVVVYCNLFISIPGIIADRFLLIPSIGFSLVLVVILLGLWGPKTGSISWRQWPMSGKVAFLSVLSVYLIITITRNFQWSNNLTLMRHDISYLDVSAQAHNLLASKLNQKADQSTDAGEQRGLRLEALQHYERSIEISPTFFNVMFDAGHTCTLLNMPDSAIYFFKEGIPLHPKYIFSYLNIADLYFVQEKWLGVIFYLQEAIRTNPKMYDGYDKLSFAYFHLHEYEKSIQVNRTAIENMPRNSLPYINMGRIYVGMNQADSAKYYLQKADTLNPGNELIRNLLNHL